MQLQYLETLKTQDFFFSKVRDWKAMRTWDHEGFSHETMRFQGSEALRLQDQGPLRLQQIENIKHQNHEIARLKNCKITRLCSPTSSLCFPQQDIWISFRFKSDMPVHRFIRRLPSFSMSKNHLYSFVCPVTNLYYNPQVWKLSPLCSPRKENFMQIFFPMKFFIHNI